MNNSTTQFWKDEMIKYGAKSKCCNASVKKFTETSTQKNGEYGEIVTTKVSYKCGACGIAYEPFKQAEALKKCEHNYLIKSENSGWLTRPGGREMKTVYCSKCLHEKNI